MAARPFRELKVYQTARDAARLVFDFSKHFPREEQYEALGEAYETQSWLDDALDGQYFSTQEFENLDRRYDAIGGMLSRMIDRADDFCKYSPGTDYRSITCKDDEFLFTDY